MCKTVPAFSFLILRQALAYVENLSETDQSVCDHQDKFVSDDKYQNELSKWANNLPILQAQDNRMIKHMKDLVAQHELNPILLDDDIIDDFQRILAFPLQTVCHVGKWVALNRWSRTGGSTDGERYLCMDNFYVDIRKEKCIIYSFGISDNYELEAELGSIGCIVHAYDPTVNLPSSLAKNVFFHKVGLSDYNGVKMFNKKHGANRFSELLPVITLNEAFKSNGHFEKEITYLKVDIEGSEIKAIPQWIQSGILKHVRQIGIELHTGKAIFNRSGQVKAAKAILKLISQLYDLGFRHISYAPNLYVDKKQDHGGKYYTNIDIVLYKPYTDEEGA